MQVAQNVVTTVLEKCEKHFFFEISVDLFPHGVIKMSERKRT